jgi:hypothetical protein
VFGWASAVHLRLEFLAAVLEMAFGTQGCHAVIWSMMVNVDDAIGKAMCESFIATVRFALIHREMVQLAPAGFVLERPSADRV